jgi:hypothetical protein
MANLRAVYGKDAAKHLTITTPRGTVIINNESGKAELTFDPMFGDRWTGKFGKAQVMVDSGVLKGMEKYTPLRTSMMIQSAALGTFVGTGKIVYLAPYSRRQYYEGRTPGASSTGPLRGRLWFARWKAAEKEGLLREVKLTFGGDNG